jgi:pimeloyl-ACP methyl ester carboxylesterase
MPYIATDDGVRIHYETFGEAGEPLVLVHGFTGDIGDWDEQVAAFSGTHRVLALDHRGHGASEAPAGLEAYSIERMALDVEAVIEDAGIGRYHLVGHSMGGGVAQEMALRNGDRLLSLTLFGTGPDFDFGRVPAVKAYMERRLQVAQEQGMAALAAQESNLPSPPHVPPARRAFERKRMEAMSPQGFAGGWHALMSWPGTRERIAAVATPSLLMAGALEPAVKTMMWLHEQIAGSELLIIEESGHSPQWERPAVFNGALGAHLARCGG